MTNVKAAQGMVSVFVIFIAFALIIFSVNASADDSSSAGTVVLTNFNILEKIAGKSIDELLSNIDLDQFNNSTIEIEKSNGVGEVDFIFENMLVKEMKKRGLRIALASSKVKPQVSPSFRFSYQLIRFSLKYPEITRKYWLGSKKVKRHAEVDVFAKLIDLRSGDVVWVGESEKKYNDEIAYSLLDLVEDEQYAFTKPERKELKWSKLAEPVVVTGIVAGLVYLFFSNQKNE